MLSKFTFVFVWSLVLPSQSVFALVLVRLRVVTTSELRYTASPAGFAFITEISPPSAPNAPPIAK